MWRGALEEDRAQSLAWEVCNLWLEGLNRLLGVQLAGHTGIVQRAVVGEAAAGSEGGRSVLTFLLLVPLDHEDILARNGKTWLTFNEENKGHTISVGCLHCICRNCSQSTEIVFCSFL